MNAILRKLVRDRANDRCEYCGVHQEDQPFFRHHIEHVVPRQHGGGTIETNLALACFHCNLHKGPNLTGIDPLTSQVVRLFNPRTQRWADHFARHDATVTGLSPIGRATVRVLAMNAVQRLQLRSVAGSRVPGPHVDTRDAPP